MKKNILDIHQPNDGLFKKAFTPEVATDFLKNRLPTKVLKRIDLSTLKVEDSSFIDEQLRKTESDRVLSANIDGEKGYIYLLVELQMEEDSTMVLRLLEYNVRLLRKHSNHRKDKKEKLPTIINLLIYAGEKPYQGARSIADGFKDPILFTSMLNNEFLIDLNSESQENILKDGKASLAELVLVSSAISH